MSELNQEEKELLESFRLFSPLFSPLPKYPPGSSAMGEGPGERAY